MLTTVEQWKDTKWTVDYCSGQIEADLKNGDRVEVSHQSGTKFKVCFAVDTDREDDEEYVYEIFTGALVRRKPLKGDKWLYCVIQQVPGPRVASVRFPLGDPLPDSTGVWGGGGG